MLYKFKSKAAGDVIMLGPHGDAVMRLLDRDPAAQGIFEAQDLLALAATLEKAVAEDEARRGSSQRGDNEDSNEARGAGDGVSLRQRVWPLVDMMRRSATHQQPIVWGV